MKKIFQKHKGNILRAFVELLVIFAGITISLLIDDWRQQRADDELVMEYMKSMYVDVAEDVENLAKHRIAGTTKMEDCKYILEVMHHPDSLSISGKDFRRKFGWLTRLDKFVASDNAYRDLTSTGNFKLISDTEIKDNIFTYYKAVEEFNQLEEINNNASADLTLGALTSHFSVRSVYNFNDIFVGVEELQDFDTSFFYEPNSEKFLQLENVLLFRHIFLNMEMQKSGDIFYPLVKLRDKLCEFTGIPTIDKIVEESKISNLSFIQLYDQYLIEYPQIHFIETELNQHGYKELKENNLDLALEFFLLNVHIFPESANAYDSLGDVYFNLGDYKSSKINYQKAIDIEPNLESAIVRLQEIEKKL